MKAARHFYKALVLSFVIFSPGVLHAQHAEKYILIKAGKMYDSETNRFLENRHILVKGKIVEKVGTGIDAPAGAMVLDYSNAIVVPGLIDAHTHLLTSQGLREDLAVDAIMNAPESRVLRGAFFAKSYLHEGFTTIRDVGNSGRYLDVELKDAIEKGYVEGPRMFVSGPIIGSMDGQLYNLPVKDFERVSKQEQSLVSGTEEAAKAVKEHIAQGVDVIKILAIGNRLTLSAEEIRAIVKTAHEQRVKVTAHCDRDWAVHAAIDAGVDGIEHGYDFKDATLERMAKQGVYLVPTYGSVRGAIQYYKMRGDSYKEEDIRKNFEPSQKRLKRAKEIGVLLVAGSDAYYQMGIPRGEDAKNTLVGYSEAGLSPEDILKMATYNAAIALDMKDRIGVIKPGSFADITVLQGDIHNDFTKTLFNVKMVMKEGRVVHEEK